MRQQIRFLTHALGRRETIKYLSIAAVGAAIAPLTGCSGSTLAFKKFAAGTWEITVSGNEWSNFKMTLVVDEKGTWKADVSGDDKQPSSSAGKWNLSGGNLSVSENDAVDSAELMRVSHGEGTASSIPETVDQEKMISSIHWDIENGAFDVPVNWDRDSQTLTLTGQDYHDDPLPILAKKK